MRRMMSKLAVVLVGAIVPIGGALAQSDSRAAFTGESASARFSHGPTTQRGNGGFVADRDRGNRCGGRHGAGARGYGQRCGFVDGGYAYPYPDGSWALYNNTTWAADSYNDWWHDRPDRAYPRWMSHNQGCARQWYMGDTLTC